MVIRAMMNQLKVFDSIVVQVEGGKMAQAGMVAMLARLALEIVNRTATTPHSLLELLGVYYITNQLHLAIPTVQLLYRLRYILYINEAYLIV